MHQQHRTPPRRDGGFRGLADDPGELLIQPPLVVADQRPELRVDCLGTEHRTGVVTVQHRDLIP